MANELKDTLKSAFSLLPDEQIDEALTQVLRTFREGDETGQLIVHWADFSLDNHFLRGGVSNIGRQETQITTNSQEFGEVHDLLRILKSGTFGAGVFHWDEARERLVWLLPVTVTNNEHQPDTRLRCLSISPTVFYHVIDRFNPQAELSKSEKRVVFQMVAGVDLRRAAADDGVSYETKRMHVKNASLKLQCGGQKEIMRKILGQMVHLLTLSDAESANMDIAESYVSRYLADDTRLTVQRLANGRLLRVLESGPSDGKPVVMIHGIMFPLILCGLSKHLHDAHIRLIVPIRTGFLETGSTSELAPGYDLIAASLDDIAIFVRSSSLSPVTIVGQSLGAPVAMRFSSSYPDLVSRIVLLSTNLARTTVSKENQAGEFYGAMRELAGKPEIFGILNRQFDRYYADKDTCREILHSLFGASPADIDVLEGKISGTPAYEMFSIMYQNSIHGMTADFSFTMRNWNDLSKKLSVPVTIVHGGDDPLTGIDELREIEGPPDTSSTLRVDAGGHFISVSHSRDVWSYIGGLL